MQLTSIYQDEGNTLAALGERLFVQHRDGLLTMALLDAAERYFTGWTAQLAGKRFACLAIINGDVGVNSEEMRERQRAFLIGMLKVPGAAMMTVILGDSIMATTARASGRMLIMGQKNLSHHKSVDDAIIAVVQHINEPLYTPSAVRDAVTAVLAKRPAKGTAK